MDTMMHRSLARGCTIAWTLMLGAVLAVPAMGQELSVGAAMPMANESMSDVRGGQASLGALAGDRGTAVIFWSNQCPWIQRYEDRLVTLAETYLSRGVSFVLVNSNDANAYPQEAPDQARSSFERTGFPSGVTYVFDVGSRLARAFGAERTPHVYLFGPNRSLVYAGGIDDSPGDPAEVNERYLRDALEAVSGGSNVAVPRSNAFGCTIKFSN